MNLELKFNYKVIIFFMLLEGFTVPWVALFNFIAIQYLSVMLAMGFLVAFLMMILLLKLLKKYLLSHSLELFKLRLCDIKGICYIGIIAGILEMIMFFIQTCLFGYGFMAWSAGFISAFFSVGLSLLLYELIRNGFSYGVQLKTINTSYLIHFKLIEIFKLSVLFGLYELIVCPITGAWIPYSGIMRVMIALFSGVIGGILGGILILILNKYFKFKLFIHLINTI